MRLDCSKNGFLWRATLAATPALLCLPLIATAEDWPTWRGRADTGVSSEPDLPDSMDQVLWSVPMGSRSTPAIVGGRVFGINLAGQGVHEQERVFALDLETGKTIWEDRFNVFHTDIPNSRVGWANVAVDPETGNIYAHGVQGFLRCYTRDGDLLWSHSLTETVGRISGYGGRTHTPIIDEDRVVISFLNSSFGSQGKGGHRYLALDKKAGEMLWWSEPGGEPEDTTYSTPVVTTLDGRRMLIAGNADGGIYAMDARTGEPIWGFQLSKRGVNSSVVVDGHLVYATHSEENYDTIEMGRVVCIDARGSGDITSTGEVWRVDGIPAGYASPLLHDDRLYVMTNFGVLHCFDAKSGDQHWEHTVGRVGKGSPVWGDGKIFVPVVDSRFAILRDNGDSAEELSAMTFESDSGLVVEIFGSPAISDGRVVLCTSEEAICFGKSDRRNQASASTAGTGPESSVESAPAVGEPAAIRVRPCEVLLSPGEEVNFAAFAFDALGRAAGKTDVNWSFSGPVGRIDGDGKFLAESDGGGIGVVTAKSGSLEAQARVRVVPPLPIEEDFESLDEGGMIDWWIGVSKAKHAIETVDGSKVLNKISTKKGPPLDRSRVYITPPLEAGYTVQADVMGVQDGRRRGDVGLINARYRLELFGRVNRLRVMSWVPGPRFEQEIDFTWEPDRWYTAKLLVVPEGDTARIYGKVWPRDETEPEGWTIEAVDPQPNLEGSAGIYAYSALAPVYYDNVKIYR